MQIVIDDIDIMSLKHEQVALARHHGYLLFGRLFMEGLTPELLLYVQEVPELATAVPPFYDEDFAASHHQAIFGFNLFPFQSIFLDVTGLVGGREAHQLQKFYQWVGYEVETAVDPDHISQILFCLAYLCQGEAQGKNIKTHQAKLLSQNLLRWLLPFTIALRSHHRAFYRALADILWFVVTDHAQTLENELESSISPMLPPVPDILADKKTGWKQITSYLLTPAYTGIYLSRDDIGTVSKQFKLPRGFGERQQMLVNLIQSSIVYDSFDDVIKMLQQIVVDWQKAGQFLCHGGSGKYVMADQWHQRMAETIELLENIRTAVA